MFIAVVHTRLVVPKKSERDIIVIIIIVIATLSSGFVADFAARVDDSRHFVETSILRLAVGLGCCCYWYCCSSCCCGPVTVCDLPRTPRPGAGLSLRSSTRARNRQSRVLATPHVPTYCPPPPRALERLSVAAWQLADILSYTATAASSRGWPLDLLALGQREWIRAGRKDLADAGLNGCDSVMTPLTAFGRVGRRAQTRTDGRGY